MKYLALVLLVATLLTACSGNEQEDLEKAAEEARQKMNDAIGDDPAQAIGDAIKKVGDALSDGEQSIPVGELKALLPDELIGLKRTSHDAERIGVGIKVTKANAEYGEGDKRLSLMITDLGGAAGLAGMGRELFATEVDREDENGFERTTEYKGHRSFQRMQTSGDQSISEIMVFVEDRFTVQLDGQNIPFKQMNKAIDQIEVDTLGKLAAEGTQ